MHSCAWTAARLASLSFVSIATDSDCKCAATQQFLKLKSVNAKFSDVSSVCFVSGGFDKNTTLLQLNAHAAPPDMPLQTRRVARLC